MSALRETYRFSVPEDRLRRHQSPLVALFTGCRSVLDIGSGRGVMLDLLRDAGIQGEGVDILPEAVAHSRSKGHLAEVGEATDFLADKVERYDGILCSHVIEHMEFADASNLLGLCLRALKPGGTLVVVTPNPQDIGVMGEVFWLDPTHRRPYPAPLVIAMLESSGYSDITTRAPRGRPARRREWPSWIGHKLLLGRYFGNPETIAVARKPAQRTPA